MAADRPMRSAPSGRGGFTLIELLTVAFVIAVLVALMLPAIQGYRRRALVDRTQNALRAIGQGLRSYKEEFGDFPPSEPDRVVWTDPDVKRMSSSGSSNLTGFYGSMASVLYLNGRLSMEGAPPGYKLRHDTTNWSGAGHKSYERERSWPPRVQNVAVSEKKFTSPRGGNYGWAAGGFADSWGNVIEYFRAYRNRGDVTARIYPRAVNADLASTGPSGADYRYEFPTGVVVGGYPIRVPASGWTDASYSDYRTGWAWRAAPVHTGSFLLVSPGPDGQFGSDDDLGNW